MNKIIEELRAWGCDIDGTMPRMLNDEDFYVSLLPSVINDSAFDDLGEALKKNDAQEAFNYAHYLKGAVSNMGLTPIYQAICDIVEPLRNEETTDIEEKYDLLKAEVAKLENIIEQNKDK